MDLRPEPARHATGHGVWGAACFALVLGVLGVRGAAAAPAPPDSLPPVASPAPGEPAAPQSRSFHLSVFPPEMSVRDWIVLPTGSYGSETGVGLGGQILRQWRGRGGADADFPATLVLRGLQTSKGQQSVDGTLTVYFSGRAWRWRTRGAWADLRRRFWGTGPDTPENAEESYRPEETQLHSELTHRVSRRLRLGPRIEYGATRYLQVVPGGRLESHDPALQTDGGIMGAGLVADFDTRDRDLSPRKGLRFQLIALQFFDGIGGGYPFFNTNLDLRAYTPLWPGGVLAGQAFFYEVTRSAPLWRHAQLGGRGHSRAYPRGRFTDRSLGAFQLELRHDLAWRLGVVGFAGAAAVAGDAELLRLDQLHASYGVGLRCRLAGEGGALVRFDAALGDDGNRQFYFGLDEAF